MKNREGGKARPQTTSRILAYFLVIWVAACSDLTDDFAASTTQDRDQLERILKDAEFRAQTFFESEKTLYLFVKIKSDNITTKNRLAGSLLQQGKAIIKYANTLCPAANKFEGRLTGLSRRLSRVEGDLYLELWSVPKEQIDEEIQSMCES